MIFYNFLRMYISNDLFVTFDIISFMFLRMDKRSYALENHWNPIEFMMQL